MKMAGTRLIHSGQDSSGLSFDVNEQDSPGGSYLKCTCAWALKHTDVGVCRHVGGVIRAGWDAWDPETDQAVRMPSRVIVPIYGWKQGVALGDRNVQPLSAVLQLGDGENLRPVLVADHQEEDAGPTIGTLALGEGRSVLREIVLDWLLTQDVKLGSIRCSSKFHTPGWGGAHLFSSWWNRDAYCLLVYGTCFTCWNDTGVPSDDL